MISSSVNAIVYYNGFIITTKHGLTSVSGSPKIVQLNNKMSLDALKQAIGNKISIQNGKVVNDIYFRLPRWIEYLDSTRSRVNHSSPVNCDFCGGEHFNDNCHLYSMKNSWWGQELHPYNQYERTPNLESVFTEFTTCHPSSTTNQNSMQNQEIQVGKSYSMENYQ
ncbi:hypothetical protein HKD37_11G031555 [Glycine soja]